MKVKLKTAILLLILASSLLLIVIRPFVLRDGGYIQKMRALAVALERDGSHFEISLSQVDHGREKVLDSTSQKDDLWLETSSLLQHLLTLQYQTAVQKTDDALIIIYLIVEEQSQTTQHSLHLLVNPVSHMIYLPDYQICIEPLAAEDAELIRLLDAILARP